MKKLVFCFDLDNVLCKTPDNNYKKSITLKKNIEIFDLLKKKRSLHKNFHFKIYG